MSKETFPFGKHKGVLVENILANNPGYIIWWFNNVDNNTLDDSWLDLAIEENKKPRRFERIK